MNLLDKDLGILVHRVKSFSMNVPTLYIVVQYRDSQAFPKSKAKQSLLNVLVLTFIANIYLAACQTLFRGLNGFFPT